MFARDDEKAQDSGEEAREDQADEEHGRQAEADHALYASDVRLLSSKVPRRALRLLGDLEPHHLLPELPDLPPRPAAASPEADPTTSPEETARKGQEENVAPAPKTAEGSIKRGRVKSRKKKGASKRR